MRQTNIQHNKIVKKNLQFNQLVFGLYDKTKSTRRRVAFESWIFIFAAKSSSSHNFEFVANTRYIKLSMLMKFWPDPCGMFMLILINSLRGPVPGDIARRTRTSSAVIG